jgi:hypothetical protein
MAQLAPNKQDVATMVCDLVRQFINIAIGGMAFAIGLSVAVKMSLWFLWIVLIVFGSSVAVGLLFQMHFIALLWRGEYSIYMASIRLLVCCQILLVATGVLLLCLAIC